ncbi:MAG: class I SAM-dependent methyltransferase [Bryobacterales bacterium]
MKYELDRNQMERDWNARAQENAFHYVASGRADWSEEDFYRSGRTSVEDLILNDRDYLLRGRAPGSLRILEIGCGVGRMTEAMAEEFAEVHAVDVSEEMIRRAATRLGSRSNVFLYHGDGQGLGALDSVEVDLAFSFIVFQHIPHRSAIEGYMRDVAGCLRVGGIFKVQTQGDPLAVLGRGDTWEGCFVPASLWLLWSRLYGYRLIKFEGVGTQYLWLWWERIGDAEYGLADLEFALLSGETRAYDASLRELREKHSKLCQHLDTIYRSFLYRVGRRLHLVAKPPSS